MTVNVRADAAGPLPIAVIGAGIVGCATAHALAQAGHDVLLIDREPTWAMQSSHANGAQLSYSFVEPLATPQILSKLPRILLGRDPGIAFRAKWCRSQWQWVIAFLASCNTSAVKATTQHLLAMAELSRIEIDALVREGCDFEFSQSGKLVLLDSIDAMGRAHETVNRQRAFGANQRVVNRNDCISIEPALARSASEFVGAIWSETDALCDPRKLCELLIDRARRRSLEISFNCNVLGFIQSNHRITHVRTDQGERAVSHVVVANGMGARALMAKLGIQLPVQSIKGYSITLANSVIEQPPKTSITDLTRKIVYAPLSDSLRVAGFAELSAKDTKIDNRTIDALLSATRERFGIRDIPHHVFPWAGLRPATPNSRPIVERTKFKNLFLNVGHGALGLTLAMGAARRIEESVRAY
jgi:D-amino-acid dehydrogenase